MSDQEEESSPGTESDEVAHESPIEPAESVGEGVVRASGATLESFWQSGEGIHALDDPTPFGQENALGKLGKPPFEKTARGRFRLLGYLATVYEHVSQDVLRASGETTRPQGHEEQ